MDRVGAFVVLLMLTVCGCGQRDVAQTTPQSSPSGPTQSEEAVIQQPPIGKLASTGPVAQSIDEPALAAQPAQSAANEIPQMKRGPRWPCWLGEDHSGVSQEKGWNAKWPADGVSIQWQRNVGIGFSSVAIADGQLFTMGHTDGQETVYCLDAVRGDTIWTQSYPSALIDNLYEGGPGSTPTIHEGRVFTLGKGGQLYCFRQTDGKILWQKDLQSDLDVPLPEWGFNSSAYVLGDSILLEAGRVVSYDMATGKKNWQSTAHPAGYGSVARMDHEGKIYLASLDCDGVKMIDGADGSVVASFPWKSPFRTNSTTPIVVDDTVYISTGYQVGCGLFHFTGNDLQLIYENRGMRNHFNNSILHDGHLYGIDGNSNLGRVVKLVCMDYQTGEVRWSQRGFGCGSLMIVDGKLLVLSENGMLVLAEASPEGYREISRSDFLTGRCWTVPVLLDGLIYGRNATGDLVVANVKSL